MTKKITYHSEWFLICVNLSIGKNVMAKVPKKFHEVFWEVNPEKIDTDKNPEYVIERILEYGTLEGVKWLRRTLGDDKIKDYITGPGHRQSIDFDFFKEEPFLVEDVLSKLKQKGKLEIRQKLENTLLILFESISCSFFKYPYPLLNKTIELKKNIQIATIPDLAGMKISAISTRSTKRDFVDLYFICKNKYSLEEVLKFFQNKFKVFDHDLYHVYKNLIYFEDAEQDVMPEIYAKTNWIEIKSFFQNK